MTVKSPGVIPGFFYETSDQKTAESLALADASLGFEKSLACFS